MAEQDHGILAPSKSERWIACPPSALAEFYFEQENQTPESEYTVAGSLAHRLCETLILHRLKRITDLEQIRRLEEIQSSKYWTTDMQKYCADYANYVLDTYAEALAVYPDAKILIEYKVRFKLEIDGPEIFGTIDCVIMLEGKVIVIDFKYGVGIFVSPIENSQLKIYALGILLNFDFEYIFDEVEMVVYQPRIDNISSYITTATDLLLWGDLDLTEASSLAIQGEGAYKTGKHCQFCKIRPKCSENAKAATQLAKSDFKDPNLLSDVELVKMYNFIQGEFKVIAGWAKSVVKHMLVEALNGKKYDGLKLVTGRGKRKVIDEVAFANALTSLGFRPDQYYKPQLLKGITELEKIVGKKRIKDELSAFVEKVPGKPILVDLLDKRDEVDGRTLPAIDFVEEYSEDDYDLME